MEPEWRGDTQFEWYRGYHILRTDMQLVSKKQSLWDEFFLFGGRCGHYKEPVAGSRFQNRGNEGDHVLL